MGIFDQLAWLTDKVKKLCCIAENNQSTQTVPTPAPGDPWPVPTANTRYVIYNIPTAVTVSLNLDTIAGKEGQILTICVSSTSNLSATLNITFGGGVTLISLSTNNCNDFYYLNGAWYTQL